VMDLQQPTSKMSTTGGIPQGTVLLIDPPDVVASKIRSAVTDSGREVRRGEGKEGIANLIELLSIASGRSEDAIEAAYEGKGYGDFKADVADAVVEMLRPVRERYLELRADEAALRSILDAGADRARSVSSETLAEMRKRMGF
jgi:tryptophanyl-tRNA synthetase